MVSVLLRFWVTTFQRRATANHVEPVLDVILYLNHYLVLFTSIITMLCPVVEHKKGTRHIS